MLKWLQKNCVQCGGAVRYLEQWSAIPKYCDGCRLFKITDLAECLKQFLDHEVRIEKKIQTPAEKSAYFDRQQLREKVSALLAESRPKLETLRKACVHDKELRKLVFRIAKERRLPERKPEFKGLIPKHIAPFLQGGAPGLGKKS